VPDTRLSFDELGMHSIRPLLRASDYRFLELYAIEKNLNSLRGHGGGLQILSDSASSLQGLRVCRRGLAERNSCCQEKSESKKEWAMHESRGSRTGRQL
jgi:hypothetical protein